MTKKVNMKQLIAEHVEKMELEKLELDARIRVAEAQLRGRIGVPLLPIQAEMLMHQLKYMKAYSQALGERIKMDGSDSSIS